jgi:DNA (cytosine-5)-methyltransferase 1
VVPGVEDAERLQGFPRGWTVAATEIERRKGTRWKLVGNAVTVGV